MGIAQVGIQEPKVKKGAAGTRAAVEVMMTVGACSGLEFVVAAAEGGSGRSST